MRVRVSTDAEVTALRNNNPGYAVSSTVLGPRNIMVILTPRAGR